MKKLVLYLTVMLFLIICTGFNAAAQKGIQDKAKVLHQQQERMRSIPDLVTPDSIYVSTELRALYYQNLKIIRILEQIRDLLQKQQELLKTSK